MKERKKQSCGLGESQPTDLEVALREAEAFLLELLLHVQPPAWRSPADAEATFLPGNPNLFQAKPQPLQSFSYCLAKNSLATNVFSSPPT